MRLAIFGDIHGNAVALEAVLADIRKVGADARVCLGDIPFRGPQPVEALETLFAERLDGVVVGNTDQWLVRGFPDGFSPDPKKLQRLTRFRTWALERIDTTWLERLGSLCPSFTTRLGAHTLTVVHASGTSTEAWFDASSNDEALLPIFTGAGACDILVYGHIHTPFIRRLNRRWLINTGSVGNPVDGDHRASYVLVTTQGDDVHMELRRVTYDVHKVADIARQVSFPFADEYGAALRAGQAI